MIKDELIERLNNKTAIIGILGLGYVGLPLVIRYAQEGYSVIGFDIDQNKIDRLNKSESYIKHIPSADIEFARQKGFVATADFSAAKKADALIICVPTPLNKYREPDLSFVINTTEMFVPYLRKGQVISLESTTYPGTTREELLPRVESGGLKTGENIFLVYSPEREDPGREDFTTKTTPKVCGGITPVCSEVGIALYSGVIDKIVPVSSPEAAEMTKLLENIHRAVNIGLVNELKVLADRMGINIHEVIDAAATKPFGFVPYYPGPGLGGHCIPIDPFYLTWKAREFGMHTRFIELAGEINSNMPEYVVGKAIEGLNNAGKALKDAKALVLGIAYKKNVDDMRESPSVHIMEILRNKGAKLSYCDPYVPVFPKMREHSFDLKSVDINSQMLKEYDLVILATDHDEFDYELIRMNSKLIVDSRGKYQGNYDNIIKA